MKRKSERMRVMWRGKSRVKRIGRGKGGHLDRVYCNYFIDLVLLFVLFSSFIVTTVDYIVH